MKTSPEITAAAVRRLILANLPDASGDNPLLFAPGGPLDSLGLVNFLADLEYGIAQEFAREVVLASDRAMSRTQSPFRDVDALTAYVLELLVP